MWFSHAEEMTQASRNGKPSLFCRLWLLQRGYPAKQWPRRSKSSATFSQACPRISNSWWRSCWVLLVQQWLAWQVIWFPGFYLRFTVSLWSSSTAASWRISLSSNCLLESSCPAMPPMSCGSRRPLMRFQLRGSLVWKGCQKHALPVRPVKVWKNSWQSVACPLRRGSSWMAFAISRTWLEATNCCRNHLWTSLPNVWPRCWPLPRKALKLWRNWVTIQASRPLRQTFSALWLRLCLTISWQPWVLLFRRLGNGLLNNSFLEHFFQITPDFFEMTIAMVISFDPSSASMPKNLRWYKELIWEIEIWWFMVWMIWFGAQI